jgi:hypothetical protein
MMVINTKCTTGDTGVPSPQPPQWISPIREVSHVLNIYIFLSSISLHYHFLCQYFLETAVYALINKLYNALDFIFNQLHDNLMVMIYLKGKSLLINLENQDVA